MSQGWKAISVAGEAMFNKRDLPHAHSTRTSLRVQPYLRARASRKALLCRVKPYSCTGRELNHEEVPFSCVNDTTWRRDMRVRAMDLKQFLLSWQMVLLILSWKIKTSIENSGGWSKSWRSFLRENCLRERYLTRKIFHNEYLVQLKFLLYLPGVSLWMKLEASGQSLLSCSCTSDVGIDSQSPRDRYRPYLR